MLVKLNEIELFLCKCLSNSTLYHALRSITLQLLQLLKYDTKDNFDCFVFFTTRSSHIYIILSLCVSGGGCSQEFQIQECKFKLLF